jgi:hypothetical protein
MESHLKPQRFETNPNTNTAQAEWVYWTQTLQNFISSMENAPSEEYKHRLLVNYISPAILHTSVNQRLTKKFTLDAEILWYLIIRLK